MLSLPATWSVSCGLEENKTIKRQVEVLEAKVRDQYLSEHSKETWKISSSQVMWSKFSVDFFYVEGRMNGLIIAVVAGIDWNRAGSQQRYIGSFSPPSREW